MKMTEKYAKNNVRWLLMNAPLAHVKVMDIID